MRSNRTGWPAMFAALGLAIVSAAAHAETERYWPPITDTPTGTWTPGRIVWAELLTADVGTAAQFYGKVFGWTFETYGPPDDFKTYTVVLAGGEPIGGMVYARPEHREKFPSSRWVGFFSVADVDAAATAVERSGGKVVIKPSVLGERGTEALFMDPEGGLFGVIHAADGDPGDYTGGYDQWLWAELWAADAQKMSAFYRGVAPFEVVDGAARANPPATSCGPAATRAPASSSDRPGFRRPGCPMSASGALPTRRRRPLRPAGAWSCSPRCSTARRWP